MFSRIRKELAQYTKEDWEIVKLILLIVAMVLLLPAVWFYDYFTSYYGRWEWLKWQYFLTESLRYWWAWVLDKLSRIW